MIEVNLFVAHRLRYKGNYMRDSYTLEEYKILNNAVIGMVPLNDISEVSRMQIYFHIGSQKEYAVIE